MAREPLYRVVAQNLLSDIAAGKYAVGEQIPTEPELRKHYGVSRSTIREAVAAIVRQGVVERLQGIGTFVCSTKVSTIAGIQTYSDFTEVIEATGHVARQQVTSITTVTLSATAVSALGLTASCSGIRIDSLRYSDNRPVILCSEFLPTVLWPRLTLDAARESRAMYRTTTAFVKGEYGKETSYNRLEISAISAGDNIGPMLELKVDSPLLLLSGPTFDERDNAMYFNMDYVNTAYFRFSVLRTKPAHRIVKGDS